MKKLFAVLLFVCLTFFNAVNAEENTDSNLKTIITRGYEFSSKGLASAVAYGDTTTVKAFLNLGYNPNLKVSKLPLTFYAVTNEKAEVLEALLSAGANPNQTWGRVTLLTSAIEKKNTEMIKILINNGVDLNLESFKITPLNFAIIKKEYEIASILLDAGAAPDKKTISLAKKIKDEQFKEKLSKYQTN